MLLAAAFVSAAEFHAPAAERFPTAGESAAVLPGGRILLPWGKQLETGPAAAAIAISPKGVAATADTGAERPGVTVIEPPVKLVWRVHHLWTRSSAGSAPLKGEAEWQSVAAGLAFESERALWVSEGANGRIRLIDTQSGDRRKLIQLPSGATSGPLALDGARHLLCALDAGTAALHIIDTRTGRLLARLALDAPPVALSLDAAAGTLWIAHASPTGSVTAVDLRDPAAPAIVGRTETGGRPSAILAAAGRVFVSDAAPEADGDSVVVISPSTRASTPASTRASTRAIVSRIALRIPQLQELRGIAPAGLAFDPVAKWLLVAEPGINAVAAIDLGPADPVILGHIPAAWMPVAVSVFGDRVFILNQRGRGGAPSLLRLPIFDYGEPPVTGGGSVTTFVMPPAGEFARLTATVLEANGFTSDVHTAGTPLAAMPASMPAAPRHVVLITTEPRTYDEYFGDILRVGNTEVAGAGALARFGLHGTVNGAAGQFSLHDAGVSPNLHHIAQYGAFSDNYYSDDEPTARAEVAALATHIQRHGIRTTRYESAARFLDDVAALSSTALSSTALSSSDHSSTARSFTTIDLPRPTALSGRFPWEASFAADADLNIGRIVEALSHAPGWDDTVVFITTAGASRGYDHIDASRTPLLVAGPSIKRTYLSRTNAGFASVERTVLELLGLPPLGLRDATASTLRDMFLAPGARRNPTVFTVMEPDKRLFEAP